MPRWIPETDEQRAIAVALIGAEIQASGLFMFKVPMLSSRASDAGRNPYVAHIMLGTAHSDEEQGIFAARLIIQEELATVEMEHTNRAYTYRMMFSIDVDLQGPIWERVQVNWKVPGNPFTAGTDIAGSLPHVLLLVDPYPMKIPPTEI